MILPSERAKRLLVPVALLFALAALLRLGFWAWHGTRFGGDTADYFLLAENLLRHHAYSLHETAPFLPSIRRAPVYPWFIIVSGLGSLAPAPVIVAQILLDAATTALVFVLGQTVATRKGAAAAALFYGLHPGAIAASFALLTETLFTFLLVSALTLLTFGLLRDKRKLTATAGAVLGAAALCRPLALLYPCVLLIILLGWRAAPRRFAHAGLFLIAAALILAPWAWRCSAQAERLLLVQGVGAVNWYVPTRWDWNQKDEEKLWRLFRDSAYGQRLAAAQTPKEVVAADSFGWQQTVANVRANPAAYLASRARSYPYLFLSSFDQLTGLNVSFGTLWAARSLGKLALKLGLLVMFSLLPLALGFRGLWRKPSGAGLLCGAMWLATLAVHLPLWIEYRFFLPVTPFLAISAAAVFRQNQ
jgi:4-amino-4-deoxy-L-arabinose transferase-like glycosyltransferase